MTDEQVYEVFYLWPAFQELSAYYRGHSDARDIRPDQLGDIAAAISMAGDRPCHLLYAKAIGDTIQESTRIVQDVLMLLHAGTRPRFGRELGLTVSDFAREERA